MLLEEEHVAGVELQCSQSLERDAQGNTCKRNERRSHWAWRGIDMLMAHCRSGSAWIKIPAMKFSLMLRVMHALCLTCFCAKQVCKCLTV